MLRVRSVYFALVNMYINLVILLFKNFSRLPLPSEKGLNILTQHSRPFTTCLTHLSTASSSYTSSYSKTKPSPCPQWASGTHSLPLGVPSSHLLGLNPICCKAHLFFSFFFFYWSIVDLQCCVNLCCTGKWLSYTHIDILFKYSFPL